MPFLRLPWFDLLGAVLPAAFHTIHPNALPDRRERNTEEGLWTLGLTGPAGRGYNGVQ